MGQIIAVQRHVCGACAHVAVEVDALDRPVIALGDINVAVAIHRDASDSA